MEPVASSFVTNPSLAPPNVTSNAKAVVGSVAKDLAESLRVLRAALPRLLDGLDSVEQLEESVDTVAETVEPLQGVAKRVGRVSDRLSRG